jgi:hypothetical protein
MLVCRWICILFVVLIAPSWAFQRSPSSIIHIQTLPTRDKNTLKIVAWESIVQTASFSIHNIHQSGFLPDMITAAFLSAIGDIIAQSIPTNDNKRKKFDFKRTQRFALFGLLDGAVGHTWYFNLEKVIRDSKVIDILAKVVLDNLVSL